MSGDELAQPGVDDVPRSGEDPEATTVLAVGVAHDRVPGEIRDVAFSLAVRGYDRREVDRYVETVNRVIAELEMSQSPQSAVKHALDRVGEQTAGVLQRAREAAEELTATALAEAEHATRRARVEAEELVENAQAEADAIRVQSAQEAEEHLMNARAEAADTLRRAKQQAEETRREAEERLAAVNQETRAAIEARAAALAEVRATAGELQELARTAAESFDGAGAGAEDTGAGAVAVEQQTEPLPAALNAGAGGPLESEQEDSGEELSEAEAIPDRDAPVAARRPRR